MSEASRSLWQLLLLTRDSSTSAQLTCEECFVLLDYDAELLSNGAALDELPPAIRNHLSLCSKCKAKIAAWLRKADVMPANHIPNRNEGC